MAASSVSVAANNSARLRARSSASKGLRQTIRRSPGKCSLSTSSRLRSSNNEGWKGPRLSQQSDLRRAQTADPVHAVGLQVLLNARRGDHAAVAHPGDPGNAEAVLQLGDLSRYRRRIRAVALEHLHRNRATIGVADQAEDDLRIVPLAIPRMTPRCQGAAFRSARWRSDRRAPRCCLPGAAAPDASRSRAAPRAANPRRGKAHRLQCYLRPEHVQESAPRSRHAVRVASLSQATPHGPRASPTRPVAAMPARRRTSLVPTRHRTAKRSGDVTVRKTAFDGKDVIRTGYGDAALEQDLETFDDLSGKARKVGEGPLLDLALFTIGLTQQDGGGRPMGTASIYMARRVPYLFGTVKRLLTYYMATSMLEKIAEIRTTQRSQLKTYGALQIKVSS